MSDSNPPNPQNADEWRVACAAEEAEWNVACEDDPSLAAMTKFLRMFRQGIITEKEAIMKMREVLLAE